MYFEKAGSRICGFCDVAVMWLPDGALMHTCEEGTLYSESVVESLPPKTVLLFCIWLSSCSASTQQTLRTGVRIEETLLFSGF